MIAQLNFACREPTDVLISIQGCLLISKMPKASRKGKKGFSYTGTNPKINQVLTGNANKRKKTPSSRDNSLSTAIWKTFVSYLF